MDHRATGALSAFRTFLPLAAAWLLLLWFVSTRFPEGPFWQSLLALCMLALPLAVTGLYEATLAKALRRERFLADGLFFRLFSGRLLLALVSIVLALLAAVFLLLRLYLLPARDWWLLAALPPLYLCLFVKLQQLLQGQYKPWLLVSAAQVWARLLCPTLLVLLYLPLLWWRQTPDTTLDLATAIEVHQAAVVALDGSVVLATLAQLLAIIEGIKTWLLAGWQVQGGSGSLLLVLLDAWVCCYLLCTTLGVLLLPRSEWRRLAGPLSDATVPPPLTPQRIAFSAGVSSFVLLFICVPLLGYLELWAQTNPAFSAAPARVRLQVEQIGADYYAPGTLDDLRRARQQVLAQLDLLEATLQQQTDTAFAAMAANVDPYLDWYYSLGGEYARIGNLLVGNLESWMAQKLSDTLQQGDVFREVQQTLEASVASSAQAQALYARIADTILAQSRVEPGARPVAVLQTQTLDELQLLRAPEGLLNFQNRLLASGGGAAAAGVLTGVVAGKLTAKMLTKSSFKLAAKALGKVAASKTVGASFGAGAGAATGAAIGSVVPGVGTVIGAAVGGIVGGIAVGIGLDFVLIEIEEEMNREAFRAELLAAIGEARNEFLVEPR